jgi:hypothetical protein
VARPSIPATQIAAVMTLQALHDYSDWEAAGKLGGLADRLAPSCPIPA